MLRNAAGNAFHNRCHPGAARTRTPMVRIFGCCASETRGRAFAATATDAMKSRRLIASPQGSGPSIYEPYLAHRAGRLSACPMSLMVKRVGWAVLACRLHPRLRTYRCEARPDASGHKRKSLPASSEPQPVRLRSTRCWCAQGFNPPINILYDLIDGEARRYLARRIVFERLKECGSLEIQPTH